MSSPAPTCAAHHRLHHLLVRHLGHASHACRGRAGQGQGGSGQGREGQGSRTAACPVPREALCACEMNCQCGSTAAVSNGQLQPADGQRDEAADGHPPWAPPLRAIMRLRVCICARMLVNMAISSDTCSSLRPLPRAMRRLQEGGPDQGGGAWRNTAVGAAACAEAAGVLLARSKLRPACAPSHHHRHPSPPTHPPA